MKIEGIILELKKMSATIRKTAILEGDLGAKTINVGGRPYDGQYEVKPTFESQNLNTKGAFLDDDILVHPISVNKTANNAGGNTIMIGD